MRHILLVVSAKSYTFFKFPVLPGPGNLSYLASSFSVPMLELLSKSNTILSWKL